MTVGVRRRRLYGAAPYDARVRCTIYDYADARKVRVGAVRRLPQGLYGNAYTSHLIVAWGSPEGF